MEPQALQYGAMAMGLGGGLALFLHGMHVMTEAISVAAGSGMSRLLGLATRNRFSAAGAGALVTAVLQSSSVVTVLVVGFTSAGLLTASKAVGVIIGANVGTTMTAQIIAFKVTTYSLALIGVGFLVQLLARQPRLKHVGGTLLGLGLVFFGMTLMSDAMAPLRQYQPFHNMMAELRNPFAGVAVGALFTALVQSSSVTTGIVIVMASQGLLDLRTGIALVFGANVGTCVTAMLATIGKPREAVRVAVVHVAFNLLGVALWIGFIPQVAWIVHALSPGGAAEGEVAAAVPRQVANAHTLFNVGNALLFIWFTAPLARLSAWLVPESKRDAVTDGGVRYLDPYFLSQPDLALDRVRAELIHMGGLVLSMVRDGLPASIAGDQRRLAAVVARDETVDRLHAAVLAFLGRLSQEDLVGPQPQRLAAYVAVANYLENMADLVEADLAAAPGAVDEELRGRLEAVHELVLADAARTLRALEHHDTILAADVLEGKERCRDLVARLHDGHARQLLREGGRADLDRFRWGNDTAEALDRCHTLQRRICRQILALVPPEDAPT